MRKWSYLEPDFDPVTGKDRGPITHTVSEQEILQTYFTWWSDQMRKAGKEDLISPENCIEDFVVVNWAWEN